MAQLIVTTSWDDGHKSDVRLAALLKKYGIKGTFYVSPQDQEIELANRLTNQEIKSLSRDFEIGAHTMSHPRLHKIPDNEAFKEIQDSKKYLEKIIGNKVTSFCYPGGNYSKKHIAMLTKIGFTYARNTKRLSDGHDGLPFEARTTVNTYNHYQDLWKIAKFARYSPRRTKRYFDWENLAIAKFDAALIKGGVYHLWGHSWMELDTQKDAWNKLERVLRHISGRKNVQYVTNGELPALKTKKLLMVAPYFPPHPGGQEMYAYNYAQKLQKNHGWDVVVVTSGERGWRVKKSQRDGLTVYELPYLLKLSNTPVHIIWKHCLKKIARHEKIDVINAHAPVPFMAEMASRAAGNRPYVLTYHMLSMRKGRKSLDWIIWLYEHGVLPRTIKKARLVVCSSDPVKVHLKTIPGIKTMTLSAGVDTTRFKPSTAVTGKNPIILFNGSLHPLGRHKGLSILLQAMPEVIRQVPAVELKVIGHGSGRQEYEKQSARLGIAEHVKFLGARFGLDIVADYQSAAVFTLPTLNDSYPLVIPEAMATGLPVVSTNVGAIPSIITDQEDGYIIEPGNVSQLAEKLVFLLHNKKVANKMGMSGRKKAVNDMRWDEKAAQLHRELSLILKDSRGAA